MNSPVIRLKPPVCDIDLMAWVGVAEPGARLEYHRGFLVIETTAAISKLSEAELGGLRATADAAYRLSELGLVHLVQQRIGTDQFAYIAIARPKPKSKTTAASLSALLLDEAA
jgi:hypothetical protein